MDNANTDRPIITAFEVEAKLRHLGLSFLIYTTYSHTAEKPKFRILTMTAQQIEERDARLRSIDDLLNLIEQESEESTAIAALGPGGESTC